MDKKEMIRLLKAFILGQDLGVSVFQKEVKKFTPNQGGIYLPRTLIGRTVTITVIPEETSKLKKIEKARDESLKIPIEKKEIDEPKKTEIIEEKPDRFNIDLGPKKDMGIFQFDEQ
jgi:hypothetical protein